MQTGRRRFSQRGHRLINASNPLHVTDCFFICMLCAACLLWTFLVAVRSNKTLAQKTLVPILLLAFATFMGDLYFSNPTTGSRTKVWLDIMSQFVGPSLAPLVLVFVLARYGVRIKPWWWLLWLVLPLGLGLTSGLLYGMMGMDYSAELMDHYSRSGLPLPEKFNTTLCKAHLFIETILFFVLVALQMVTVLVYLVWRLGKDRLTLQKLWLFVRNRGKLKTNTVILLLLIPLLVCVMARCAVGTNFYGGAAFAKVVLPLVTTLLITLLCNVALNVRGERVRVNMLGGDTSAAHAKTVLTEVKTEKEVGLDVALPQGAEPDNAAGINMTPDEYSTLLKKFTHELVTKKGFLDDDITLSKLVKTLGYNRTYLSYLVNKEYGIPFRDVVGQLRIDHAMKYMKEHPNCLQETVASECGFTSAPAFNRKFTQVVGMTPRLWCQRTLREGSAERKKG